MKANQIDKGLTNPRFLQNSIVNVWPKPRLVSWPKPWFRPKPLARFLSSNFTIDSLYHQHLAPAANLYLGLVRTEHYRPFITPSVNVSASAPPLQTLSIDITDLVAPLQHGVNETYSLSISEVGERAYLTAKTAWGATRGLETFSQLVWGDPLAIPVGLYIWDAPLFSHRGLMLDTSRNYYEAEDIFRTIEATCANKLNVFHWHVTDSQSFPLMVPSEAKLAAKGQLLDVGKLIQPFNLSFQMVEPSASSSNLSTWTPHNFFQESIPSYRHGTTARTTPKRSFEPGIIGSYRLQNSVIWSVATEIFWGMIAYMILKQRGRDPKDGKLWPRTLAIAETLWSANRAGRKRSAEATDRMNEWRYRMVSRGVKAEQRGEG
ncbi:Beta-hexosaminidase 2 [Hibiscus syriacus]|uniref:beta-N-acetylhexosaminidase n=1 Tax=Hibiscus syriacus TaxID=106335 RepID=A0A6A3A5S4_HIBSY|nr:Beta-hexosaminidase 2 [Hibiscus syriacus]